MKVPAYVRSLGSRKPAVPEILPTVSPVSCSVFDTACKRHDEFWAHVYHPQRFMVLSPCAETTGIVESVKREADGDPHIRLKVDKDENIWLNEGNIKNQHGDLVVELPCSYTVKQTDAKPACKNWANPLGVPSVGDHIHIVGSWVEDTPHNWREIHPVFYWEKL